MAREAEITPTRLTQLLHLTTLSPEVQQLVMALPASTGRGPLERELRAIAKERDHKAQLRQFRKLVGEA